MGIWKIQQYSTLSNNLKWRSILISLSNIVSRRYKTYYFDCAVVSIHTEKPEKGFCYLDDQCSRQKICPVMDK